MEQQQVVRPFVLGVLLTDEWAASPNMGETTGDGASKAARMKAVKTSEGNKTILAGQAVGSWHRQTLYDRFGWKVSELQETVSGRDTRSFYTQCQPIDYEEDDGRGYLAAVTVEETSKGTGKDGKDEKIKVPLTTKRTSPFMLSQFQSVAPNVRMNDWGILARGLDELDEEKKEGLIFRAEIASAAYAGLFALNLSELGRFSIGVGRDLLSFSDLARLVTAEKRAIYKKPEEERTPKERDKLETLIRALKRCINAERGSEFVLAPEKRKARAHDLIAALADLEGGAHMTRRLYNVAPSTALVAYMNGGNCLPPHIIRAVVRDSDEFGNKTYKATVDVSRLRKVLWDNQDRFLQYNVGTTAPGYNLFFGTLGAPSIENEAEVKALFDDTESENGVPATVHAKICQGPREAIRLAASSLPMEWFSPDGARLVDGSVKFGEALLEQITA
jgi:CRISPR-associated protein Cas7/Cst2/DevR subtype I-B